MHPRLQGGRWSSLVLMGENLCQHRNSGSCDATWSSSSDKIVWISQALVCAISCRELHLRSGLVKLRIVEFVQPVLGKREHLPGSCVRCHEGFVLGILILALSSCFSDGLVQRLNPSLKSCDLLGQSRNRLLSV